MHRTLVATVDDCDLAQSRPLRIVLIILMPEHVAPIAMLERWERGWGYLFSWAELGASAPHWGGLQSSAQVKTYLILHEKRLWDRGKEGCSSLPPAKRMLT